MRFSYDPIKTTTSLSVLSFMLILILQSCTHDAHESRLPVVNNGVINLRTLDFDKNRSLRLTGMWEFYPGQLLQPTDFNKKKKPAHCSLLKVPGLWKDQTSILSAKGEGTYRLELITESDTVGKNLILNRIYSGYRVWINGILAEEKGMPGFFTDTGNNYIFIHNLRILPFTPVIGRNEIIIQVINYDYKSGGIGASPVLENQDITGQGRFLKHTLEMIIVGIMLFFAVYNMLFYYFRRENITALYSGLFCLVMAVNVFNLNILILSPLGPLPWPRNPYMVDFITIILAVFFSQMTMRSVFPDDYSRHVCSFARSSLLILFVIMLFLDFKTADRIMHFFFIFIIFFMLYNVWVLVRAVVYQRDDVALFFIGFITAFAGGVNDVLYVIWVIDTAAVTHYTMVVFCITTTIVVAHRYSREMMRLSENLIEKNLLLEELDRFKDRFLASTSHELRTPLHGIIGLSESLLAGTAGRLPDKAYEDLSLIVSSSQRLADMVNDLLDMARIQNDGLKLNLRCLDLYKLSESVIMLSIPLKGDKPLEIINSMPRDIPAVSADEDRIRQVLHNLFGNAVKFTSRGKIEISARVIPVSKDENKPSMVEISVSDTGIGIPVDYHEKIFEAYNRVDTGDIRAYTGTGLGLAISKQIIELHCGSISVTSGRDSGSVFSFTLPVWDRPLAVEHEDIIIESIKDIPDENDSGYFNNNPAAENDPDFTGKPVILVVDDNPVNIRILQNYFESKNCIVKTATDGIIALETIEKDTDLDIVLLDIMMPVMSGYEVCRRIRAKYNSEELPVIMLTAKNMMADIDAAFSAGANDYIVKPFHINELFARTGTMLKLKNIRKSAATGITIRARDTMYSFKFSEIIHITSHSKNIIIHTEKSDFELPVMMKDIISRLPSDMFQRIHKSHIINMQYIHSLIHIISGRYRVRLMDEDDTELAVGPAFLKALKKKLKLSTVHSFRSTTHSRTIDK